MAWTEKYITNTAPGGGAGTSGSPWTLAEFVTALAGAGAASGWRGNMLAGTYTLTAAVTIPTAGPWALQGYSVTPGDGGRALFQFNASGGATYSGLTLSGANITAADLSFSGTGVTGTGACNTGLLFNSTGGLCAGVAAGNFRLSGVSVNANRCTLVEVESFANNVNNSAGAAGILIAGGSVNCRRLAVHDNAGSNTVGVLSSAQLIIADSVIESNGSHGLSFTGTERLEVVGSVLSNNGGDDVRLAPSGVTLLFVENSVIQLAAGYGVNVASGTVSVFLRQNAFRSNTSGNVNGGVGTGEVGSIALSGDPFTDAADGDFRLNNTAGAGAACRGAGRGTFLQTQSGYGDPNPTIGYPDMGAAQHQETASGGGALIVTGF